MRRAWVMLIVKGPGLRDSLGTVDIGRHADGKAGRMMEVDED